MNLSVNTIFRTTYMKPLSVNEIFLNMSSSKSLPSTSDNLLSVYLQHIGFSRVSPTGVLGSDVVAKLKIDEF